MICCAVQLIYIFFWFVGFENSYKPHTILPTILQQEGYETYGYGKLSHWESNKQSIWTEHYRGKWAKEGEVKFM